jgi:hypothetical protein
MISQGSLKLLQQFTDEDTSFQIAYLKLPGQIMEFQVEIAANRMDIGFMKATFDHMYALSTTLPHEKQLANIGKMVGMVKNCDAQRPQDGLSEISKR